VPAVAVKNRADPLPTRWWGPIRPRTLYTDVANGKVEMGFLPRSEIIAAGIVEYAGPLPPDAQSYVLFSAGIATSSKQPEAAKAFVEFVTSTSAQASLKSRGYENP
jgi:molybdate transport system substrate-binding protein